MTEKNSQMIETVQSVDSYKLWEESASGGDQTTAAIIDAEILCVPLPLLPSFISTSPTESALFLRVLLCRDFISESIHIFSYPYSQTISYFFVLLSLGS